MIRLPQIVKGCQSCVNFGRETIDAQDARSGYYCKVADLHFDQRAALTGIGVRYEGLSPKTQRHYTNPCRDYSSNR